MPPILNLSKSVISHFQRNKIFLPPTSLPLFPHLGESTVWRCVAGLCWWKPVCWGRPVLQSCLSLKNVTSGDMCWVEMTRARAEVTWANNKGVESPSPARRLSVTPALAFRRTEPRDAEWMCGPEQNTPVAGCQGSPSPPPTTQYCHYLWTGDAF